MRVCSSDQPCAVSYRYCMHISLVNLLTSFLPHPVSINLCFITFYLISLRHPQIMKERDCVYQSSQFPFNASSNASIPKNGHTHSCSIQPQTRRTTQHARMKCNDPASFSSSTCISTFLISTSSNHFPILVFSHLIG